MRQLSPEAIVALVGFVIVCISLGVIAFKLFTKKVPRRRLKVALFQAKWKELQKLCGSKETWAEALGQADHLLGEALKKRHFKGKNTGERLVAAQHMLSDNDSVWFGHKLSRRLKEDPDTKLKEKEAKDALMGIRQALKDLGALR